jgi:hypothetical protein
MSAEWSKAAETFSELQKENYWSVAFCKFAYGACLEVLGERTDAILAFAEVPNLVPAKKRSKMSALDAYAIRKVETFQASGYQDMDFTMSVSFPSLLEKDFRSRLVTHPNCIGARDSLHKQLVLHDGA